ncbi:hypothetical protein D3C80_1521860 [compost metagenome]
MADLLVFYCAQLSRVDLTILELLTGRFQRRRAQQATDNVGVKGMAGFGHILLR